MQAKSKVRRVNSLVGSALLAAVIAFAISTPARSAPEASTSIINGSRTSISKWPWQVALSVGGTGTPRQRTFCGGSIVAPTMVLTAAHCAVYARENGFGSFHVIAGRTRLNATGQGVEVPVKRSFFPRTRSGKLRYGHQDGWDVSLISLSAPLTQQPIKLLGEDEQQIARPGRRLTETGWGTMVTGSRAVPDHLMVGGTNIQSGSVCTSWVDGYFESKTQVCLGDARGRQANCFGDSGGPGVVSTSDGYRLAGVVSYGAAGECAGTIPNIDTRAFGPAIRDWVRATVLEQTGIDPVGSGATAPPVRGLCEVPVLAKMSIRKARSRLRQSGCSRYRIVRRGPGNWVRKPSVQAGWRWNAKVPIRLIVGR